MNEDLPKDFITLFEDCGLLYGYWWQDLDGDLKQIRRVCRFHGIECYQLYMLAFVKSCLQSYLRGKMGSLESEKKLHDYLGQSYLEFSLSQKGGGKFLRVQRKNGEVLMADIHLDFQQASMLDIIIGKAIGSLPPPKQPLNKAKH